MAKVAEATISALALIVASLAFGNPAAATPSPDRTMTAAVHQDDAGQTDGDQSSTEVSTTETTDPTGDDGAGDEADPADETSDSTGNRQAPQAAAEEPAESATAETETETAATVIAKRGDRGSAVRDLQARLNAARFNAGPVDGIFGPLTQTAVTAFQSAVGLPATGIYDTATSDALADYTPPARTATSTLTVRDAQRLLVDAGFNPGPIDGIYGPKTRAGLEAFQRHVGVAVTGRIDQATSDALRTYEGTGPADTSDPADRADQADQDDSGGADPVAATVREVQRALKNGPFDPGPIDGVQGTMTRQAIWALEKLAGIPMDGQWGSADQAALDRVLQGQVGGPATSHSRRWVEIDLSQQLVKVYDPGNPVPILVSHASSGSGIPWRQGRYSGRSITPIGSFTIFRRISGWRQSSLGIGSLYNPLYFTSSGIAVHGSRSVPSYPASHGCVRVPMHIAQYLPSMLPNGTPVEVMR